METIKNYLETMFANMPDIPDVRKAKAELLQMMEDKYNELMAEGLSENQAVAQVIAEFGNLDELAESLGLVKVVKEGKKNEKANPRRKVSMDEAKDYIADKAKHTLYHSLGIFFCIISVICPMVFEDGDIFEAIGVTGMFAFIAVGVGLIVFNASKYSKWNYLKNEACQIDLNTAKYVSEEKERFASNYSLRLTIGIILCVICWVPSMYLDEIVGLDSLAGAPLFVLIAVGVFLIVHSNGIMTSYETLLNLNDSKTISGTYRTDKTIEYENETVADIMSVYYPTVLCVYLIWSFITFDWHISWIIWPVAAVIRKVINVNFGKKN